MTNSSREPVIRTPDQRLRVFVSSTLQELADERVGAREAIAGLRLTPVMFEIGARPHPPRELYRAYLEQSHIFIGIYWQSYGWVAPDMDISGLEDEYRLSGDKPKLIYIRSTAPEREPRLVEMLDHVKGAGVSFKRFSTAEELRALIQDDLAVLLTERFEQGNLRLSSDLPGRTTRAGAPNNLAIQLTRFIGRERDLKEMRAILVNARLVTISGAGGLGKTRLSIELAASVSQDFNSGVWMIELAGLSDGSLVSHAVATVVGVRESGQEPLDVTLSRHLEPMRALIVLDNCEHLVEGCARLVQLLLQRCPALTVLSTSREVLDVPGEVVWRLAPLALPEGEPSDVVEDLLRSEAIALFVDRATLADPSFRLDRQNASRVVEICSRLDGIPLALELAAASISVLSLDDLAGRLEHRFRALRTGSRTAARRQQTLRAAIDWSHELLTDAERALFRRLSVFAGGFGLDAAEVVCAGADPGTLDVVEVLSRLVDKSLIPPGDRSCGRMRYRILETIREYASERLSEAGESSATRRRHAEYYLRLAEEGDGALRGAEQSEWLHRLDRELDNFRVALAWAKEEDPGVGMRLASALVGYWFTRGVVSEGKEWLDRFLAACATDAPSHRNAMNGAGLLASVRGEIGDARRLLERSIELSEAAQDMQSLATGLSYLGRLEAVGYIGPAAPGRAHLERAISLYRTLGDRSGEGFSLGYLGYLEYYAGGNLPRGAELLRQSMDLLLELGDRLTALRPMLGLGLIALEKGDAADARRRWREALALSGELRDTWTIGLYLESFAALAAHESQAERSMTLTGAAEMVRSRYAVTCPPPLRAKLDQVAPVRGERGPRAEAALARGRSMTLDAAIAYAMIED